jgi:hypothetical protein
VWVTPYWNANTEGGFADECSRHPGPQRLRPGIGAAHQSNNENNYIVFYL